MRERSTRPKLRISHTATEVIDTLGPGRRSVVWVQGCTIRCEGCIVPESWGDQVGQWEDPAELALKLLANSDSNLTVSGGEPTEQAPAVSILLSEARRLGRTTWVYTGRRLEDLVADGDEEVLSLLSLTDVLVDGPYELATAGGVGYRGSRNQRILRLTDAIPVGEARGGKPGKIEIRLDGNDSIWLIGIPEPGALTGMSAALAERGITLGSGSWRWRGDSLDHSAGRGG